MDLAKLIKQDNLERVPADFKAAWLNYREEVKKNSKKTKLNSQLEFNKVIRDCLKEIKYYWTNSTGGIYMKGLGYFTLVRATRKFQSSTSWDHIQNIHRTNGYSYLLTHLTNLKPMDSFGGFKIKRPYDDIKMDAYHNIVKGRRYTSNSFLIREYLKKRIIYDI